MRFVPLVTCWRYLRAEVSIRLHRYEGDLHTGGRALPQRRLRQQMQGAARRVKDADASVDTQNRPLVDTAKPAIN